MGRGCGNAPALLCLTADAGFCGCSYPIEDDGPTESDLFGEHHTSVRDSRPEVNVIVEEGFQSLTC